MDKPKIVDTKPMKVNLEAGEYHWCSCGRSSNQPWCDGSHRGTSFKPHAMTVEELTEGHMCMCKHTKNPGFCDGSHARLTKESNPSKETPVAETAGNTPEEPTLEMVKALARYGLTKTGHHGEMGSMGVPRPDLPSWDDIQILTAQLHTSPLLDNDAVGTELVIGPNAS